MHAQTANGQKMMLKRGRNKSKGKSTAPFPEQ